MNRKRLIVIAVFLAGVFISVSLFFIVNNRERHGRQVEFLSHAGDIAEVVENELADHIEVLYSISDFYASSQLVERDEFRQFTAGILSRHPGIVALDWIPRLPDDKRPEYEDLARREGHPDFQIREFDGQGYLIKSDRRQEYYPIYYVEPFDRNKLALGVDISTNPARWAAAGKARDENLVVATEPVELFQEEASVLACLMYLPVYANEKPHDTLGEKRENLFGFLALVFRIGDMVETSLKHLKPRGVDIFLYDLSAGLEKKLLYYHCSRKEPAGAYEAGRDKRRHRAPYSMSRIIDAGTRKWSIECYPSAAYLSGERSIAPWLMLVIGLLITSVSGVYLFGILGRETSIKEIVEERSRELKDVYERLKESQVQLGQSSRMAAIGKLASGVAHEINNPLTGVLNSIELLRMEIAGKKGLKMEDIDDLLKTAQDSAMKCKDITRSLLDFSRASVGALQPASLNRIAEKVISIFREETRLLKIKLDMQLEEGLPETMADPQLIQQAIFDIFSNAVWAVSVKPETAIKRISVETHFDPVYNNIQLYVSDTGIGIPKDNLHRIFEPFFTTKAPREGAGLGLSIAYNILKQHKGAIEVQSEAGRGSTFKVTLPVVRT